MRYKRLGRTGLKVSAFCLGCVPLGLTADEQASFAILDRCLDLGVNFLDTANIYGFGRSEEIIGRWLASRGHRDEIVLATKVGSRMGEGPNQAGASRYAIFQEIEASLRRLRTDHLDLYWIHRWDPDTPIEESLSALDDLVRMGKVRYLGASNFAAWELAKSLWASDRHGWERFVALQPPYSLTDRRIEAEIIPFCADQGLGVVSYNPLAKGVFTGRYTEGREPPAGSRLALSEAQRAQFMVERNFRTLEKLKAKAAERGATPAQLAIAWVESHPHVTAPIVGVSSIAQLEENVGALEIRLAPQEREELASI